MLGLPLVALLQQDGTDEADGGGLVGKDADEAGAAPDLFVQALDRVVQWILIRCWAGKSI